jgi:hypothetical protein
MTKERIIDILTVYKNYKIGKPSTFPKNELNDLDVSKEEVYELARMGFLYPSGQEVAEDGHQMLPKEAFFITRAGEKYLD